MNAPVMAALPELYALATADEFPLRAVAAVRRVVGGSKCDYTEVDLATGDFRVLVSPEPSQLRALQPARRAHMTQHPVLGHFLRRPAPGARLISDFLTPTQFRRLGLYGEFFAHLGVDDQLTALLTPGATRIRAGISIDRDRRSPFTAADRRRLDVLQPHLVAARANAARFSAALGAAPVELGAGAAGIHRLTGRQREILALVSCGRTNAQVALELDISVGTVRKHMEHILRSLEASTRTAAAALYLQASRRAVAAAPWTATEDALVTAAAD
jgi:DNA-binding CsgD family transcriptional regulator